MTTSISTSKPQWLSNLFAGYVCIYSRYRKLNFAGKCFVWFIVLFHIALLIIVAIFGPVRIFQLIYNLSQRLRMMRFGWLILASFMVVASFPPMAGFSTSTTVCGFAYGLEGFYVAGPATLVGSGLSFIILRLLFKRQITSWTSKDKQWQALEQVIAAKGLPLIILIRLSPFPPYVYSQPLFASISVVKFWQFMLATVCFLPKILLAVFIGSRIAKLSDGEQRGQMDTTAQILNGASIAAGLILGIGVGWFLYRTTQEKIKSLKDLPSEINGLAVEALDEAGEEAPMLQNLSTDTLVDIEEGRQADDSLFSQSIIKNIIVD